VAGLSGLLPEFVPYAQGLVDAAGSAGLQPRVTSVRRTHSQQVKLYQRFLAGQTQYPVAPPGRSAHEFGYAFDMITSPMEALPDVGAYWIANGGVWHASDAVHFEFPGFVPQDDGTFGDFRDYLNPNNLPWYLQFFLPNPIYTGTKPVTSQDEADYLRSIGIDPSTVTR
jgi:hypothetical protein